MRVTVTVEDQQYEIEIEQNPFEGSIQSVKLDGKNIPVKIADDWNGQYSKNLILGDKSYEVEFELDANDMPTMILTGGQAVRVHVDFPGKGKLKRPELAGISGSSDQVRAPLPGKVIGVKVVEGQEVAAGNILVLLEAMKMENELHSPRDGKIREILVKEGDGVELDQVLINLE
ncbi:MAG TPA: biotin/lipoyl-containing protein [bacterium]|jgi:biotin carboxyl carrier protein